jgi:uncharacterized protein YuzE
MEVSLLTNESNTQMASKETEASLSFENNAAKEEYLKDHIMSAIGLNLTEIIKDNKIYEEHIKKDKFYLSRAPSISLRDYIKHLMKYTKMNISTLINAIIYIDNFCEKKKYIICLNNIYLLLLSSCLISMKYNEDIYIGLDNYAKICGISLENLKNLEYSLLLNLEFSLFVKEDLYESYLDYFSNYDVPIFSKDMKDL